MIISSSPTVTLVLLKRMLKYWSQSIMEYSVFSSESIMGLYMAVEFLLSESGVMI